MSRRVLIFLVLGCGVIAAAIGLIRGNGRGPVSSGPFIAWAVNHAIPIKTVEAGNGFDDLQPLKPVIGGTRVLGMGEATHGTREFFQFKHRAFEFLVQEMGFTAIAFETGFPEAAKINAYVLGGSGDGPGLMRKIGSWLWNTEEVLALVEWMREYNLKPTTVRKVQFYGFDMQGTAPALREAVSYLKEVDPEQARPFELFASRAIEFQPGRPIDRQKFDEAKAVLRRLGECLETHHARFAKISGERGWRLAGQNIRVALQAISLLEDYKDEVRDTAMTQNVHWILQEEGATGRIMLWAHNVHVGHPGKRWGGLLPADLTLGYTPMGTRLRQSLGRDYQAWGFSFNQGGFRSQPVKTDSVGPAPADSLDGALSRVGPPRFILDVRSPVGDPGAARWLGAPHAARSISAYGGRDDHHEIVVSDCYDAVVFFELTTASRRQAAEFPREKESREATRKPEE